MAKRKFTAEDKLKIVKEASEQGVTKTLAKYNVYPATYYSWRRKLKEHLCTGKGKEYNYEIPGCAGGDKGSTRQYR